MATLTKERRGEIAEILLKQYLFDKGITLHPGNAKRELGNLAKKTGLSRDELNSFLRPITEEALKKVFSDEREIGIPNANKYTTTFLKK